MRWHSGTFIRIPVGAKFESLLERRVSKPGKMNSKKRWQTSAYFFLNNLKIAWKIEKKVEWVPLAHLRASRLRLDISLFYFMLARLHKYFHPFLISCWYKAFFLSYLFKTYKLRRTIAFWMLSELIDNWCKQTGWYKPVQHFFFNKTYYCFQIYSSQYLVVVLWLKRINSLLFRCIGTHHSSTRTPVCMQYRLWQSCSDGTY